MTNKEKIEEFMSQIDESWSDLKKLRYICVKLCEIYEYDPKYSYATDDKQIEYMNRLFEMIYSLPEEERVNYEEINKICVNLAEMYNTLIKRARIPQEKYSRIASDFFYNDDDGTSYFIHPVEELYNVKTKSTPTGFRSQTSNDNSAIEQIDREIGLIDERGYVGNINRVVEENSADTQEQLADRVEKVLQQGESYLKKVIGTELENVELHKFYKQLLKTAFPNNYCIVKPLATEKLENIQYVILAKLNDATMECISFLYDKSDKRFHKKTVEEIRAMIKELGLSDVGKKDVGCINNLCDSYR